MKNQTAKHTTRLFNINWLCRYPRPRRVVYDNWSEFIGFEFQELLKSYGIDPQPTTVKNPQANSVIECLHLTLGNQLCCTTFKGANFLDDINIIVQACACAAQTVVPSNNPYSPAQLTFGMDMLFCQHVIVDWEKLKHMRQEQAITNNTKENKKRVDHDYHVGDLVLIITPTYPTLSLESTPMERSVSCEEPSRRLYLSNISALIHRPTIERCPFFKLRQNPSSSL